MTPWVRRRRCVRLLWFLAWAAAAIWMTRATVLHEAAASPPTNSNDWLVLCTADGRLFSVHAWTGRLPTEEHEWHTDPLIGRSVADSWDTTGSNTDSRRRAWEEEEEDDDDETDDHHSYEDYRQEDESSLNMILPGLDGRLYWQQDDGSLQALQLEISSLLEQPVRSCRTQRDRDCGILTATVETSLLALNANGRVQWYDRQNGPRQRQNRNAQNDAEDTLEEGSEQPLWTTLPEAPRDDSDDTETPVLLLQRRDYHIKHVRTTTGQQAWNISLGTWQALDFGAPVNDDDEVDDSNDSSIATQGLPGSQERQPSSSHAKRDPLTESHHITLDTPVLPAIVFKNDGQTLIAVDLVSMKVLWTMDTPSIVASVFGMQQGQWKPVQVLQEQDLLRAADKEGSMRNMAIDDHGFNDEEDERKKFYAYTLDNLFSSHSPLYTLHPMKQVEKRTPDRQAMADRSSKPKFPLRRVDEPLVCLPGDDCRNIPEASHVQFPMFPLLPSPPPHVERDGLYIPWRVAGCLLGVFVVMTVTAGRLWYVRKKRKWLEDMGHHQDILSSAEDRQFVPGEKSIAEAQNHTSLNVTTTAATLPLNTNSNEQSQVSSVSSQELKESDKTHGSAPVTVAMTAIGGIPLVRYSRYATEFEEQEPLGKGGFGTVWRVRNLFDGRHYAMKKVHIHGTVGNPQFQQRLERTLREVKILAALDHPNIVRYYNAWLELEQDNGEGEDTRNNDSQADESSVGMTKCYSSSLLTESLSQWPSINRRCEPHRSAAPLSPMRRKAGMPSDSSLLGGGAWRPRAKDDDSDYIIFESDSREMAPDSTSYAPKSSDEKCDSDQESPSKTSFGPLSKPTGPAALPTENVRHILYIQMQLCTQRTISDLLENMTVRKGSASTGIDIPQALKLFLQIAQAVTYVHSQGLIHRDLKPANCFVDEMGSVQVGDFGLSRESAGRVNKSGSFQRSCSLGDGVDNLANVDHTAGVGTRSYASPEQMNGSDYESSTDIYSLGIILFELVYPMHTGMERTICLTRLRSALFPNDFDTLVGNGFPTIPTLLLSMLSEDPKKRPSAVSIVSHIKSILSEYTIQSLDESQHQGPDMLLLRIEAEHCADALTLTIDAIHSASETLSQPAEVVQYSLRSSSDGDRPAAIIELAIKFKDGDGSLLVSELEKQPSIYSVRQVRPRSESTLST